MDRVTITPDSTPGAAPVIEQTSSQTERIVADTSKQAEPPQRPAHIPEKFWKDGKVDIDGMAKSYGELESQFSKKTVADKPAEEKKADEKADPTADQKKADETPKADDKKVDPAADKAFTPYFDEFAKDGQLSEESFKALEAKGLPRAVVENYIEGMRASAERETNSVLEVVGGQENYTKMIEWAGSHLPIAEIHAYDEAITSGDSAKVKLAVSGLHAQFVKSEGSPANLVRGGAATGIQAFRSTAEVTAAMSDPRYRTDPAYQEEVMQRIAASDVL